MSAVFVVVEYVRTREDQMAQDVIGVFSTRELADECADAKRVEADEDPTTSDFDVLEVEMDKPLR